VGKAKGPSDLFCGGRADRSAPAFANGEGPILSRNKRPENPIHPPAFPGPRGFFFHWKGPIIKDPAGEWAKKAEWDISWERGSFLGTGKKAFWQAYIRTDPHEGKKLSGQNGAGISWGVPESLKGGSTRFPLGKNQWGRPGIFLLLPTPRADGILELWNPRWMEHPFPRPRPPRAAAACPEPGLETKLFPKPEGNRSLITRFRGKARPTGDGPGSGGPPDRRPRWIEILARCLLGGAKAGTKKREGTKRWEGRFGPASNGPLPLLPGKWVTLRVPRMDSRVFSVPG